MSGYNFQTGHFGISERGIHLLRSGHNYRTISFSEIKYIQIEKGRILHNWWLIFLLGTALIVFGVYVSVGAIQALIKGDVAPRHARMVFLLLIPVVGGYFVYNSLQTGLVLKVDCTNGYQDMFPLEEIIKDKKLNEFAAYLKEKLGPGFGRNKKGSGYSS